MTLSASLVLIILVVGTSRATITGDQPPASGDWSIQNPTTIVGETVSVDGNITVNSSLSIKDSTIILKPGSEGGTSLNVTSDGNLSSLSVHFKSGSSYRYRFSIHGIANITDTKLEDCYSGLRARTSKSVRIVSVDIIDFNGTGMYLEDTSGAFVDDVVFEARDYFPSTNTVINATTNGVNYTIRTDAPSIIWVEGGDPSISNIDFKITGTFTSNVVMDVRTNRPEMSVYSSWPMVLMSNVTDVNVTDIRLRELKVACEIPITITNYVENSRMSVYARFTVIGIALEEYGNVGVGRWSMMDFNQPSLRVTAQVQGAVMEPPEVFETTGGFVLIDAVVMATHTSRGPHIHSLTIKDMELGWVRLLTLDFQPGYKGTSKPVFESTVKLENISLRDCIEPISQRVSQVYSNLQRTVSKVIIQNSTFHQCYGSVLNYSVSGIGGILRRKSELFDAVIIANSTFRDNGHGPDFLMNISSMLSGDLNVNKRTVRFTNNTVENNNGRLALFGGSLGYDGKFPNLVIEDNTFTNNSWSPPPEAGLTELEMMIVEGVSGLVMSNNTFIGNEFNKGIQVVYPQEIHVLNNTFTNCFAANDSDINGFVRIYWYQHLSITGNTINNNMYRLFELVDFPLKYGVCRLECSNNSIHHNEGPIFYFTNAEDNHSMMTAVFRDNRIWDNEGTVVDYHRTHNAMFMDDNDARFRFSNNTVWNCSGTVFRNFGNITIVDNTFTDCGGYVVELLDLYRQQPLVANNTFLRCRDCLRLSAKEWIPTEALVWLYDLGFDCDGTAMRFERMEATVVHVNVSSRASESVVAYMSYVDAYDSHIEDGSARVEWSGAVRVWFRVDAQVVWANASGEDSGNPAALAAVTFFNATDQWMSSVYTNDTGVMPRSRVLRWSMTNATLRVHAPYTVMVSRASLHSNHTLPLNHSHRGADALRLLLVDPYPPDLGVDASLDGAAMNVTDLEVTGFAEDRGSGVLRVDAAIDGGRYHAAAVDAQGTYNVTLHLFPEGTHDITVRVWDVALNLEQLTVTVEVDRTPPALVVTEPVNGTYTNVSTVWVRGTYEPGSDVTINSNPLPDRRGRIEVEWDLWEGPNQLTVVATDRVGNTARVVLWVTLDTLAPTLVVLRPVQDHQTTRAGLEVTGHVDGEHRLEVRVHRHVDVVSYPVEPDAQGEFSQVVTLSEGANRVEVLATDLADNVARVVRRVVLDSTPPFVEITRPANGTYTRKSEVVVLGTYGVDAEKAYINGRRIPINGTLVARLHLEEGRNVIELVAIDLLGNEGSAVVVVFLDTVRPTIELRKPDGVHVLTNVAEVAVAGIIREPVDLKVAGKSVPLVDTVFNAVVTLGEDGVHQVPIEAVDRAGNVGTLVLEVDLWRAPPVLDAVFDPPGARVVGEDNLLRIYLPAPERDMELQVIHRAGGEDRWRRFQVEAGSSFRVEVELVEGENVVVLGAVDDYGNTNMTSPHAVLYSEEEPPEERPAPGRAGTWALLVLVAVVLLVAVLLVLRRRRASAR